MNICSSQAQFRSSMFRKNPIVNLENFDKDRIYWGFFLGFNSYDFKINYKNEGQEIAINTTTGFSVGIVSDLRLAENWNLRFEPGLYITQRNLIYPNFIESYDSEGIYGIAFFIGVCLRKRFVNGDFIIIFLMHYK